MAERLREVAEIPQQFIKEGTLVCQLKSLWYLELINSSLTDVRNLPRMVCLLLSAVKLREYGLEWMRECRLTARIPTAMPSYRRRILSNGIHRLPSQVNPYPNVSSPTLVLE